MPSRAADRNLLFGILALQMDFITRDQLVAAMNAWVLDKAKPFGQILLVQGALGQDVYDLLEVLTQKHLARHSGDPQKSLAALSSLGSTRQQLEQVADADLQTSLAQVASSQPELDPYATRPPLVGAAPVIMGAPTSEGLRFRVLRPHARGGLGQVSVALDRELDREVALKEIQDQHADDPESRARFLREAKITGGLEHPGIVPVYGLGHYGDGRPFYAMRFIRGDSLKDAIERFHNADVPGRDAGERTLELRKLLGRFLDVCDAVAYAHSRGVLHRDLKPGNIMLGKYGETLVVDWGLAKLLEQTDRVAETRPFPPAAAEGPALTQFGAVVGTLAFMSPEQAAGRLDQLGPASDVYSLGATLYCLLTGRAPFSEGEEWELLKWVQEGSFPRPRQVKRNISAVLEAICLKAMALLPGERYASVRDLASDLEHWLADEPVTVWQEPVAIQLRRWLARHRLPVTTAAAVVLMAMVSLGAVADFFLPGDWLLSSVLLAAVSLAVAVLLLTVAQNRELLARKREQQHREQAEAAFQLASATVEQCFTAASVNPELKDPSLQPLQRELQRTALELYRQLTEWPALDLGHLRHILEFYQRAVDMQQHVSPAHRELGLAYLRLAVISGEIGAPKEARAAYCQALAYYEQLLGDAAPGPREAAADLAPESGDRRGERQNTRQPTRLASGTPRQTLIHGPVDSRYRQVLHEQFVHISQLTRQLGRPVEAAAATWERHWLWPNDPTELYQAARELALCIPLVGQEPGKPAGDLEGERRYYADLALAVLDKAVAAGFHDEEQLRRDPALEPLRPRAEFQALRERSLSQPS